MKLSQANLGRSRAAHDLVLAAAVKNECDIMVISANFERLFYLYKFLTMALHNLFFYIYTYLSEYYTGFNRPSTPASVIYYFIYTFMSVNVEMGRKEVKISRCFE